jgi:DNA repair ATPase RecN
MTRLQEAERIGELARMLGSDESSEAARENAKDLIAQAQSVKA